MTGTFTGDPFIERIETRGAELHIWKRQSPVEPDLPDVLWRDVYGIVDGEMTALRTIIARYVPERVIPETWEWPE